MKKTSLVLASLLAFSTFAGCKDASAKLKDSNSVIMSVAGSNITKGQIYSMMLESSGEGTAITEATKQIASIEVPVDDEIQSSAEQTLTTYTTLYGDTFTDYLKQNNMTEDDYLNDYLIPSLQAEKLTNKYIETEWDSLMTSYDPIQATVLTFTAEEDANAALSALKDGSSDIATAIADNNSTSTGEAEIVTINTTSYDTTVLSVIRSASPDDGWTMVPGTTTAGTFYLVRVENNDPSTMVDEVTTALSADTTLQTEATTYFFRKYNFHVYDIDLFNSIATNNPECLVQVMAAPTATPVASVDPTASAESK